MAVAYDQGAKGVHSPHKQPVAHRMALELRRVGMGETLHPASEQGPWLIGACIQSFDSTTNTTIVRVKLNNSAGLFLNDTQGLATAINCSAPGLQPSLQTFRPSLPLMLLLPLLPAACCRCCRCRYCFYCCCCRCRCCLLPLLLPPPPPVRGAV